MFVIDFYYSNVLTVMFYNMTVYTYHRCVGLALVKLIGHYISTTDFSSDCGYRHIHISVISIHLCSSNRNNCIYIYDIYTLFKTD